MGSFEETATEATSREREYTGSYRVTSIVT